MKKLAVYILVFLISLNNCFFVQLFKLPVLFQHFEEHQNDNGNLGFVDFLAMHYWGDDINDSDDDRDMQLPFKKVDHHVPHLVFIPNRITYTTTINRIPDTSRLKITYNNHLHPNPHLGALFRPPIV
ncbi:hypothetical protein E6C50_03780 [Flavobacterium supellecticarium]|uniref:Uncharacterized protein n=1 Tax=Flavobacterium supellecticarium TaxID=2565924 RepID=A0A4S4A4E1_9FLAO|nr:hypothetical protein [Flavobacterium supellecticarium]THF53332.1 hypothetical protein E6C50_03780 [Flavobacterium supellecticarium]